MAADDAEPLAKAAATPAPEDVTSHLINQSSDQNNSQIVVFDEEHAAGPLSEPSPIAIKLNFINRSNDANNSCVVVFSKNVSASFSELAIAWRVIKNCGPGWNHPFTYPLDSSVAVVDSYGNYSPSLSAQPGQAFEVIRSVSGDTLKFAGEASSPAEIEVRNNLPIGAMSAVVLKDGRTFAQAANIVPEQKSVFQFKPTIWIGVVSQVEEGQVMNAAIISQINTEISLMGVASADIVMTGGGPGPTSKPFTFTLENVTFP